METVIDDTNHHIQSMKLLKPREIAVVLNISRSFAYRLIKSGEIPTIKLGRSCRVRPQDLVSYIEKNLHNHIDSS